MELFITVLTPCYKKFNGLSKAIESVSIQEYSNFEYFVVDDGSENFDQNVIEKMLRKVKNAKRTKILHWETNMGTVKSLNQAICSSQGEYVVFLAGDDEFYDNYSLRSIAECFENNNADIVTAKQIQVDRNNMIRPKPEHINLLKEGNNPKIFAELCCSFFLSGATTSYSKKILEKYDGFNEEYLLIEDFPFCARALLDGISITFLDRITIKYGCDGVTAQKRNTPVNLIIQKDRELFYQNIIFPNIKRVPYFKRKEIRFKYYKSGLCSSRFSVFIGYIKCLDVISYLIIRRCVRFIRKTRI